MRPMACVLLVTALVPESREVPMHGGVWGVLVKVCITITVTMNTLVPESREVPVHGGIPQTRIHGQKLTAGKGKKKRVGTKRMMRVYSCVSICSEREGTEPWLDQYIITW